METDQIKDKSKTDWEKDLGTPILNADWKQISLLQVTEFLLTLQFEFFYIQYSTNGTIPQQD